MRKVFLKTIVSTEYELPYVLLNLLELDSICDEFWITEANRSNTGEIKGLHFKPFFDKHIKNQFPKARYIAIDISEEVRGWSETSPDDSALRWNEFLTRSRFIGQVGAIHSRDIVISVDGDEVIYRSFFLRLLLSFMQIWPFKRPLAFLLTLRQFMFYVNLYMSKYDFYSPSIAHSQFYTSQEFPHWRGGGKRIKRPLGCHFSWIMTSEEMYEKILSYSHRDKMKHLHSRRTLEKVRSGNYQLFEPDRTFGPLQIDNHKNYLFPQSLKKVNSFLNPDLVLDHESFWAE